MFGKLEQVATYIGESKKSWVMSIYVLRGYNVKGKV